MKVYVCLVDWEYDGGVEVKRLFDSEKKAIAWIKGDEYCGHGPQRSYEKWEIE